MHYYALYTKCVYVYVCVWCVYYMFCLYIYIYMCVYVFSWFDKCFQCARIWTWMTLIVSFIFPEINECLSQPCMNGGTCRDRVASYLCECEDGFSGQRCQTGNTLHISCLSLILYLMSYWHYDIRDFDSSSLCKTWLEFRFLWMLWQILMNAFPSHVSMEVHVRISLVLTSVTASRAMPDRTVR